jgi:sterol desaturase/sphingolipid hydroxylase (fatty acid hydroxylase superfamily)
MIQNGGPELPLGIWAVLAPVMLFAVLAIWEVVTPRRKLTLGRYPRWVTHSVFFVVNAGLGRLLLSLVTVASAATWAQANGFGLFHLTSWPAWIEILLAFVVLDFAVWLQHFMMHKSAILWRMHKVHHSDRDLDVSSALRFHPFELTVSVLYKSAWVAILGVSLEAAITFELWLSANALFNHSNIALPRWLDRPLRWILVTPDYHFVHHSVHANEQNTNFGFALTLWDRIAGLYRSESADGRDQQIVGLAEAQDNRPSKTIWSMLLPLR